MSEKIKLVVAIPTAGRTHFSMTFSLASLMARLTQGIPTRPDAELEVSIDGQVSSCIHSNREQLAKRAIENEFTHLLFIDDDMGFDSAVINIMLGRRQPVVACNYLIKEQYPKNPEFVAVGLNGRRIITNERSVGLQEIAYSGFGVSLFEVDVFRRTPQPWFLPVFVPESSLYTTEDNPFYERVRNAGFKCYVDHDASKLVDHNGDNRWKWDQWKPALKIVETPKESIHERTEPKTA